jgi:hypothetical protein
VEGRCVKLAILTPTVERPYPQYLAALEASVSVLDAAGIEHKAGWQVGSPYISHARAELLRRAMDAGCDTFLFIDHDLSWNPEDILKLVSVDDPVVAGTYRFKKDEPEYMATIHTNADFTPQVRADGCIRADRVPAGFLKLTLEAVRQFMRAYPELLFGEPERYSVDLFNHGAHQGVWWGEDYAFSRRWGECGGEIWLVPDLQLDHHGRDKSYPGNFHQFLLAQPR